MITQTIIAAAAVLSLATGAEPAPAAPAAAAPDAKVAKVTRKDVTDRDGNKLSVDVDDTGKIVRTAATNRDGKSVPVIEIPMKDMSVCVPKAPGAKDGKPLLCQPLQFVSDDATIKFGAASCTCYIIGGHPVCYGDTCK